MTVVWRTRSRTKAFTPRGWPGVRLGAPDEKVTYRPSALMDGPEESPSACWSVVARLARTVRWATRSRTKRSVWRFVSPRTRLSAIESNTT